MIHPVDFMRLCALRGGCSAFLRPWYDRLNPLLRCVAGLHRRFRLRRTRLVVVVGSLGKTTARRALMAALGCPRRNYSFSNYGSCLSENLLRIRSGDTRGVLEVGVAGPGFMQPNADMIRPDVVVVTSIKSEHNRSFATLLDTRKEKVRMVAALSEQGLAVLNGDDPHVRWMATQTMAKVLFFGFGADNDVRAANVRPSPGGGTVIDVLAGGETLECRSALQGGHMVYPMLAAIAVARAEKLVHDEVAERLANLQPEISRMQVVECPGGVCVVDDSYKGAIESFHAAFAACATMAAQRKILVLGNVEEPPGIEREIYRELGALAAGFADEVVCIGKDSWRAFRASAVRAGMRQEAIHLVGSHIEPAAALLKKILRPGDLVLIKGSSRQKLRRIALELAGRQVGCRMRYCNAKVGSCDVCPLVKDSRPWEENHYVRRIAKM